MDPNATLAELRGLIERWQAAGSRGTWDEHDSDRAIELTADLDRWISRGGFLPRDWASGARAERARLTRLS
jgi:hypothetical protein